jgi:hypothetical protein
MGRFLRPVLLNRIIATLLTPDGARRAIQQACRTSLTAVRTTTFYRSAVFLRLLETGVPAA